ncbi:MAG: hypothetical protein ACQERD_09220 [Campylobacterota bacterium]
MENNITIKKDSEVSLYQSQNLMDITNKILKNSLKDNWIEKLFEWADKNNIPNTIDNDIDTTDDEKNYYWRGIPRDKDILLKVISINLSKCDINVLPTELFNLINLKQLILSDNKLTYLPNEIIKLKDLSYLSIDNNQIEVISDEIINSLINLSIFTYFDNPLKKEPKKNKSMEEFDNMITKQANESLNRMFNKMSELGYSENESKELFNEVINRVEK